MMRGEGRAARVLVGLLLVMGGSARALAQDTAPQPAVPVPVPESLAPDGAPEPRSKSEREALEEARQEQALSGVEVSADARPIEGSERSTNLEYLLEKVTVVGHKRTRERIIRSFVPLKIGATLDVNDPEIEALRYRLLGTGWYDRVDLRLERGTRPGWVVLVIEVEERSTLVFQQLAAGVGWTVEGVGGRSADQATPKRQAEPYLGLALAETNLLGTGRTLAGELLVSPDQQGLALTFFTPQLRSSRWSLRVRGSLVKGREYFGGDENVIASVDCSELPDDTSCELRPPVAVVDYWRSGLTVGTARDVGVFTRLSLEWHGDFVKVPPGGMPVAASEQRGRGNEAAATRPIDFSIEPGRSYVSMLTVGLLYDKRDSAILPSRGSLAAFNGDLATALIGSDYSFVRVQASFNHWFPLSWGHTVRTGVFAGALYGYAPFFYKFFVSDLTDLQPSRILGLNLDHRPAPNLFGLACGPFNSDCGTAIAQMRQEELAMRLDAEYVWPLVRGRRKFLKSADAFFLLGLYLLADLDDLRVAMPGYEGIARLPIDLTVDAGVRLDTKIGVFQIGVAKLAWLPFQ